MLPGILVKIEQRKELSAGRGAKRLNGEDPGVEDDSRNIMPVKTEVKPHVFNQVSLFAVYRTAVIRNDEVVRGILLPGLGPEHTAVRQALDEWDGRWFVQESVHGTELTLVRAITRPGRERWWLHILLAALTLLTTTISGAYFAGFVPLQMAILPIGPLGFPFPTRIFIGDLIAGLGFALPLLGILLAHELGHYLAARRHGMDVSPPYFVPAPHWLNLIGTFGAFIRLRSVMINRAVLMDVGAAGPVVSFLVSIPAVVLGLAWSTAAPIPMEFAQAPFVVVFDTQPVWLGGSLIFQLLAHWFGSDGSVLLLHPLAFAGWLGLFVTALNLFPLAQLDGGHILFALGQRVQRYASIAFLILLLVLGYFWWGWWLWAALILVLGRGSIRHPAVFDPDFRVEGTRRWVGWACILIFVLSFIPIPIRL